MSGREFEDFFREEYQELKKKDDSIMSRIVELEEELASLEYKYNRVARNPLYRAYRAVMSIPALPGKLRQRSVRHALGEKVSEKTAERYLAERQSRMNPYSAWRQEKYGNDTGKREPAEGYKCVSLGELPEYLKKLQNTAAVNEPERDNAKKEWVIFLGSDERLAGGCIDIIDRYIKENPHTELIYGDEDCECGGTFGDPWFKPDYSPDTLETFCYMGGMAAVSSAALKMAAETEAQHLKALCSTRGDRDEYELFRQFLLMMTEVIGRERIAHIAEILNHRAVEQPDSQEADSWMPGYLPQASPEYAKVQPDKISIVILSKDHPDQLECCVKSITEYTDYPQYGICVVDNGSNGENREKYLELSEKYGFDYFHHTMEFNFSKLCNLGASKSDKEASVLLFLNDDTQVIESGWLKNMAVHIAKKHVGVVGAKLWFSEKMDIQHAGVTNMGIGPSHKLVTWPDTKVYYHGANVGSRDVLAVTGACLMIKRELFESLEGFDEDFPVAYNDVDLCFRVHERGYYIVQCNDAVLIHRESATRGADDDSDEKWERLLADKARLYERHPGLLGRDPFYSALLNQDQSYYGMLSPHGHDHWLSVDEPQLFRGSLKADSCGLLHVNPERTLVQRKIHSNEPDILLTEGWFYVSGADNAAFDIELVISADGKDFIVRPGRRYRPDVAGVFPGEKNIELSGYVSRILLEDLGAGRDGVFLVKGIILTHRDSGRKFTGMPE